MNYTTLSIINLSPSQERITCEPYNLSMDFISDHQDRDPWIEVFATKCKCTSSNNNKTNSEDRYRKSKKAIMENIIGVKTSDTKIKLSFSVDRLLGNDNKSSLEKVLDVQNDRIIGRTNCNFHSSGNNCSLMGYDCCKYPINNGPNSYSRNSISNFTNISNPFGIMDMVSVVRPMPIRVGGNNMTAALPTSVSTALNGIAQLLKYQTPTTAVAVTGGAGVPPNCITNNNLKPISSQGQQYRQEASLAQHHPHPHHHHHHSNNSNSNNPSISTGKRKRSWSRAVFSNLQRKGLEIQFQQQKYITKPDRRKLAARLNLTDAQVKVWFQNRRMKWRHTRENLKSGQEKAVVEDLPKSNEESNSSSEDEIDVVAE